MFPELIFGSYLKLGKSFFPHYCTLSTGRASKAHTKIGVFLTEESKQLFFVRCHIMTLCLKVWYSKSTHFQNKSYSLRKSNEAPVAFFKRQKPQAGPLSRWVGGHQPELEKKELQWWFKGYKRKTTRRV